MKQIIALLLAVGTLLSAVAHANERRADLRDREGRSIVRIEIGDDRDDRDMLRRVRRLEQAVRDLQTQVYQLQDAPRTVTMNVCSGNFFSAGTFVGKAESRIEAMAIVIAKCQRAGGGIFCKERDVRCDTIEERL